MNSNLVQYRKSAVIDICYTELPKQRNKQKTLATQLRSIKSPETPTYYSCVMINFN